MWLLSTGAQALWGMAALKGQEGPGQSPPGPCQQGQLWQNLIFFTCGLAVWRRLKIV